MTPESLETLFFMSTFFMLKSVRFSGDRIYLIAVFMPNGANGFNFFLCELLSIGGW